MNRTTASPTPDGLAEFGDNVIMLLVPAPQRKSFHPRPGPMEASGLQWACNPPPQPLPSMKCLSCQGKAYISQPAHKTSFPRSLQDGSYL